MSSTELIERRLMKRKHYVYAAYLGVISSLPILRENIPLSEIIKAVIAKIAAIVSIKSLDNVNDVFHSYKQAVKSLEIQLKAFTSNSFKLKEGHDDIKRAENSMYQLAYFTNQIVSKATNREGPAFKEYKEDFNKFIMGQTASMKQKFRKDSIVDIRDYLRDVNEKAVGRIWVDVDFCFFNSYWYLDSEDFKTIYHLKKGLDLIFKGCNIYDDVCDLEIDLQDNIWNSVIYLALDNNLIKTCELSDNPRILYSKVDKREGLISSIELGNLLLLNGLEEIEKAKHYASKIDIDALKYGINILRLFALRKWLIKQYVPRQFHKLYSLQVSEKIMEYEQYIRTI